MKRFFSGLVLLSLSACSLFEDVNMISYNSPDVRTDMDMNPADMPDMPDVPVDMPDMSDMPDMPDMESCLTNGCTEPEICNTITHRCGSCGPGADCPNGLACEEDVCVCPPGTNLCSDGQCTPDDDSSCGFSCQPCEGGQECRAGTCGCPVGEYFCNGQCVMDDPNACGVSCAVCPAGINANAVCSSDECGLECQTPAHVVYGAGCASKGGTCPSASQPLAGTCDVVYQTGCQARQVCTFTLRGVGTCSTNIDCLDGQTCDGTKCIYFETGCSTGDFTEIPIGTTCSGTTNRCVPGGLCSAGICKKMCDAKTGMGCATTQVCRALQAGSGAGVCESQC